MNTDTAAKLATYNGAVATYNADPTDANLDAVRYAYVALPAASRGSAMAAALATVDPANIGVVIDAHNDLPTVSSRVEKRQLTDDEADAIRQFIIAAIGDAGNGIVAYGGDSVDDVARAAVDNAVRAMLNAAEKLNIGSTARTHHNVDPTDVVPAGSELVCTYKGGNVSAVLNADNTVTMNGTTYESLSAAAAVVTATPTANGWHHWRSVDNGNRRLTDVRDNG